MALQNDWSKHVRCGQTTSGIFVQYDIIYGTPSHKSPECLQRPMDMLISSHICMHTHIKKYWEEAEVRLSRSNVWGKKATFQQWKAHRELFWVWDDIYSILLFFVFLPQREARDVWCLPPDWNLRAVILFPFPISSLVFSAWSSCSFCLVIFLLMVHSLDFFPENSQIFFSKG